MSRTTKAVTCLLLAMPIMLIACDLAMAGKPVPPPTNPTPVEYQLTWIDGPSVVRSQIDSLNNNGVAVGVAAVNDSHRGFRWNQASGFQFLDDLSSVWVDLDLDPPGNVTGWRTSSPHDTNDFGQIVGTAVKPGELTRTFIYTEGVGFHLLPTEADILGYYRGMEISDAGDVLGTLEVPAHIPRIAER